MTSDQGKGFACQYASQRRLDRLFGLRTVETVSRVPNQVAQLDPFGWRVLGVKWWYSGLRWLSCL